MSAPNDKLMRKREVAEKLAGSLRTVEREASVGGLTRVKVRQSILVVQMRSPFITAYRQAWPANGLYRHLSLGYSVGQLQKRDRTRSPRVVASGGFVR